MKKSLISLALVSLAALSAGCSFAARTPETYAADTQKVLESKTADIKKCYDDALKTKQDLVGRVTVKFTVKNETGELTGVQLDPANTNAPEPLPGCVVAALQGLKLNPPDEKEGIATFSWEFQSAPAGAAPAAPPAAAAPAAAAPAAAGGLSLGASATSK
jgi:hypothetical protein